MCVFEYICSLDSALSACVGGLALVYRLYGEGENAEREKKKLNAMHINSCPCQTLGVASAEPVIVAKNG